MRVAAVTPVTSGRVECASLLGEGAAILEWHHGVAGVDRNDALEEGHRARHRLSLDDLTRNIRAENLAHKQKCAAKHQQTYRRIAWRIHKPKRAPPGHMVPARGHMLRPFRDLGFPAPHQHHMLAL